MSAPAAEGWTRVSYGEVRMDRWGNAVGVVKPHLAEVWTKDDGTAICWSFAPLGSSEWSHEIQPMQRLLASALRRHLSGIAA